MRRLIACYFDPPSGRGLPKTADGWSRLARVLEFSARRHCPEWSIEVERIPGPAHSRLTYHYIANTHKLDWWASRALAAPLGDEIVLMDADAMVLGPLDEAFAQPFDIAITTKRDSGPGHFPINGGVVLVRATGPAKNFLARWRDLNRTMLLDSALHRQWQRRYGGMNQSALGMLLETGAEGLDLIELPCAEWNCEDASWRSFDPARTRIVHVKSALRRSVFAGAMGRNHRGGRLAGLWLDLYREASAA